MLTILVALAIATVITLVNAALLWAMALLLGGAKATYLRALGVYLVVWLASVACVAPSAFFGQGVAGLLALGLGLLVGLAVAMGMIQSCFGLARWRSLVCVLLFALVSCWIAAVAIPLRLFVMEAFYIPTNGMAPTQLGEHQVGVCPACGGQLILPLQPDVTASPLGLPPPGGLEEGICRQCRLVCDGEATGPQRGGDRILVDKLFARPQRWDLVVFRRRQPNYQIEVRRLVGLPGDTLELREGELYINGSASVVAPEMVGLVYAAGFASERPQYALTDGQLVTLDEDEYFVLGDFSNGANDSRHYGPIHKEQIIGVATVIYWPPTSWRVLK
jgi:signal peptidase I